MKYTGLPWQLSHTAPPLPRSPCGGDYCRRRGRDIPRTLAQQVCRLDVPSKEALAALEAEEKQKARVLCTSGQAAGPSDGLTGACGSSRLLCKLTGAMGRYGGGRQTNRQQGLPGVPRNTPHYSLILTATSERLFQTPFYR